MHVCVCIYVLHMHAWSWGNQKKGFKYPGERATDNCESPFGFREWNLDLQEQHVFWLVSAHSIPHLTSWDRISPIWSSLTQLVWLVSEAQEFIQPSLPLRWRVTSASIPPDLPLNTDAGLGPMASWKQRWDTGPHAFVANTLPNELPSQAVVIPSVCKSIQKSL